MDPLLHILDDLAQFVVSAYEHFPDHPWRRPFLAFQPIVLPSLRSRIVQKSYEYNLGFT